MITSGRPFHIKPVGQQTPTTLSGEMACMVNASEKQVVMLQLESWAFNFHDIDRVLINGAEFKRVEKGTP